MESGMTELFSTLDGKLDAIGGEVKTLAADVKSVIGNGQPGRLGVVEAEIKEHGKYIYKFLGALIILGILISLLGGHEIYAHLLK